MKNNTYIGLLILLSLCSCCNKSPNLQESVITYLEFENDTIPLGIPFYFHCSIKNISDDSLYVKDMRTDYHSRFRVYVEPIKGDKLMHKFVGGGMSDLSGCIKLLPEESHRVKMFMNDWVSIDREGDFNVKVSTNYRLSEENPYVTKDFTKVKQLPTKIEKEITIINNEETLNQFIVELIKEIKDKTKGRINKEGDIKYGKGRVYLDYNFMQKMKVFYELKSDKILPFLIESYEKKDYLSRQEIIAHLQKFSNKKEVLKILFKEANGKENTKSQVFKDSISISWSKSDLRQQSLIGIMKSNEDESLDFLLAKKNDNFPHERYMILLQAEYLMDKESRYKIYNAFKDDTNQVVARKAEEMNLLNEE